jgi:cytochrome c-type biogenesis protein CcmF
LFVDVLNLGKISVGPPFFNAVFIPLMVPVAFLMAVGPMLSWKRGNLMIALSKLKFAGFAAFAVTILTWIVMRGSPSTLWAGAGLGLAAWLLVGTLTELFHRLWPTRVVLPELLQRAWIIPRAFYGMTMAHAGLAIVIIGVVGSTAWKTEKIQVMHLGDTVDVSGYQLTLKGVEEHVQGPNYIAVRATFTASKNGNFIAELKPEKRLYDMPPRPTTNAAIHTNFLGDLYVVIGDPGAAGGYVTRLYYNPLVPWIFIGAGIMAVGGIVSLTDRRYRIGVPHRKSAVTPVEPAPS